MLRLLVGLRGPFLTNGRGISPIRHTQTNRYFLDVIVHDGQVIKPRQYRWDMLYYLFRISDNIY